MFTKIDGMVLHLIPVLGIRKKVCLPLMVVIHVNQVEFQIMGGDFLLSL